MNEAELRALIREAVERHLGSRSTSDPGARPSRPGPPVHDAGRAPHPSQAIYFTLVNVGDACLIEPGVTCNHCGYCKTHGH